MSRMVGTKMTRILTPASSTTVMQMWRIQLNSLEAHRRALTEVRICGDKAAISHQVKFGSDGIQKTLCHSISHVKTY